MRINFLITTIATTILLTSSAAAQSGVGEATALQAEKLCFEQKTKNCCDISGAKLSIKCELDGFEWFCATTATANDLVQTTEPASEGFRLSRKTGQEGYCEFKAPRCGDTVGECHLDSTVTKKTCEEKVVAGAECTSGTRAATEAQD